jgi:Tol biopolymer transport system component
MRGLYQLNLSILIFLAILLNTIEAPAQKSENLKRGVVKITTTTFEDRQRTGTGFIVRQETKALSIVTASHVVEGSREINVEFYSDRGRLYPGKVIGMEGGDPQGLAVLSVSGEIPENVLVMKLNPSKAVSGGDPLTIIGFPDAGGPWAVSKGEIVGRKGNIITFSGAIEEGNSGGPLLKEGEIIGVVVEANPPFAAAVPSVIVRYFLESWGVKFAVRLRSVPAKISLNYVIKIIREMDFSHPSDFMMDNVTKAVGIIGNFENEFENRVINNESVVIDHATGLMWQQSGSMNKNLDYTLNSYVIQLNLENFAGFSDWRLPTIDELASLMTSEGKNKALYINPHFDSRQKFCGSSDVADEDIWFANYENGKLSVWGSQVYVRAVRTIKSKPEMPGKPVDRKKMARSGLSSKLLKNTRIAFLAGQNYKENVYLVKADGSERKRLTSDVSDKEYLCWSPDGKKISFRSNWHDVYTESYHGFFVMNRDGSDLLHLTNAGYQNRMLSWTPDGKKVVFVDRGDLYTLHADNTGRMQITNTPNREDFPVWSPDGQKVAYYTGDLHLMNSDGSGATSLIGKKNFIISDSPEGELLMVWSPDGKKIAFVDREIYIIDADGTNLIKITEAPGYFPSWSPDSKKLAFLMYSNIYTVNPDGSGLRKFTRAWAGYSLPSWSPDGSMITFASNRFGNWEIYIMNADGSNPVRITDTPDVDEKEPVWSPFLK